MIEVDMLPTSVVEGNGYQDVINILEPAYQILTRRTVTRLIETHYEERKQELLNKLATVASVAITTDCWTALTAENCLSIRHFLMIKSTIDR